MAEPQGTRLSASVLGPGSARFSIDLVRPGGPRVKATQMHLWGSGTQEVNLSSPNIVHPTEPTGPHFGPSYSFSLTPNSFLCFPPHKLLLDSSYMSRFWLSFFFFYSGGSAHTILSTFSMFPLLLVQLIPGCLLNWNSGSLCREKRPLETL